MMDELILSGENAIFLLIKVGLVLFLLLYLIFAIVVIRQARLMTDTLKVGFENQIRSLAIIHFVIAFCAFILSIVILFL